MGTHRHITSDRFQCFFCDDGAKRFRRYVDIHFNGDMVAVANALALAGGGFAICTWCLDDGFIAPISNQNLPDR